MRLWEVKTGRCLNTFTGHMGNLRAVAFHPQNHLLVSICSRETRLWDLQTGRCCKILPFGGATSNDAVAFSPDGRFLLCGHQPYVVDLEAALAEQEFTLAQESTAYWPLDEQGLAKAPIVFSPDGQRLASIDIDWNMRIWDIKGRQCIKILKGDQADIWGLRFHPDGQTIATSSVDETIKLWDIEQGICLKTLGAERPYERMNITDVTGLTKAQIASLKSLEAISEKAYI